MDLDKLYGGSFVNWTTVAASWNKRTVPSRLLLFAARRYLAETPATPDMGRAEALEPVSLPEEIKQAHACEPPGGGDAARLWGEFVDAAVAAEMEMVSYGERPLLLHELRTGLKQAAEESTEEAGAKTARSRWFLARHDALPGTDLPDSPEYLPI